MEEKRIGRYEGWKIRGLEDKRIKRRELEDNRIGREEGWKRRGLEKRG